MTYTGFEIVLRIRDGYEVKPTHAGKLLIALDEFCETYGYEIDTFKTITRYFPD